MLEQNNLKETITTSTGDLWKSEKHLINEKLPKRDIIAGISAAMWSIELGYRKIPLFQ